MHSPDAQLPRREDRKIRQADGGRQRRRNPHGQGQVVRRSAPNEALRGKTVSAVFEVLEVKKLELPELTPQFLEELGRIRVGRRTARSIARRTASAVGISAAAACPAANHAGSGGQRNWELPPELLKRQARRELERAVLELRRSGFSDDQIRAHENDLRQNSMACHGPALKEHFILERIAEEEKIEDEPQDYETEIRLIAAQSGESARACGPSLKSAA